MRDKCFVDTYILIYAMDRSAGEKHTRALELIEQLWSSSEGVISTQVLQEAIIYLRRKVAHRMSARETREALSGFFEWEVFVNTEESILKALDIQERFQTSFWDALILQAAQSAGAAILYTEDLADGQHYGTVRVINPLKN
jgi:predicted nucleic acid-binding protein